MTKVIMHGCNGKMGQMITNLIAQDSEIEIVAGVDAFNQTEHGYPIYKDVFQCKDVKADVIIDFSSAMVTEHLLDYCAEYLIPCVLCTTGLSAKQIERVKEVSKKTALLRSANMSLGVNMLLKLLQEATKTLDPAGFDIEIVEKHHNQKVDAPSGTALALADSINDAIYEEKQEKYDYIYDRSQVREKRSKKEIGISAIRGGTIVGDHDVIFAGEDEVVTLSHRAYSKAVFAKGAIQAAKFLGGKPAGLYDMSDVIGK